MTSKYVVNIIDTETCEVVRTVGKEGLTMHEAVKVEYGLNINLNHERFRTSVDSWTPNTSEGAKTYAI